jgi:hypothetical protein
MTNLLVLRGTLSLSLSLRLRLGGVVHLLFLVHARLRGICALLGVSVLRVGRTSFVVGFSAAGAIALTAPTAAPAAFLAGIAIATARATATITTVAAGTLTPLGAVVLLLGAGVALRREDGALVGGQLGQARHDQIGLSGGRKLSDALAAHDVAVQRLCDSGEELLQGLPRSLEAGGQVAQENAVVRANTNGARGAGRGAVIAVATGVTISVAVSVAIASVTAVAAAVAVTVSVTSAVPVASVAAQIAVASKVATIVITVTAIATAVLTAAAAIVITSSTVTRSIAISVAVAVTAFVATAPSTTTTSSTPSTAAAADFHSNAVVQQRFAINLADSIFGITRVRKFYEGETRRIASDPNILNLPKTIEFAMKIIHCPDVH